MCCTQATSKVHKCIQEQAMPPRKHKTVSRNRQINIRPTEKYMSGAVAYTVPRQARPPRKHKHVQEQATPPCKHKTVSRNRQINIRPT